MNNIGTVNGASMVGNVLAYTVGSYLAVNAMKQQSRLARQQMVDNAEYQTKQVNKLLSNNALSYLKNGVGISGSALDVINQNAYEGYTEIANNLAYQRKQIQNSLKSYRNQQIMGMVQLGAQVAGMATGAM